MKLIAKHINNSLIISLCLLCLNACTSYTLNESNAAHFSLEKNDTQAKYKHAPIIKVFDVQEDFNKIGTPKANNDGSVYVDSETPTIFTTEQSFEVQGRTYKNLIYRVHFSEIPFSIIPFHLSTGKNVGLMFFVTLDDQEKPILFSVVHTCGCYKAIMATSHTPKNFYPDKWQGESEQDTPNKKLQRVYGEILPTMLALNNKKSDICVAIRPQEHRIMDVYACEKGVDDSAIRSSIRVSSTDEKALTSLRELPSDNGPVSFFHEDGIQEGHVKGAIKPWESLMLSWPSLDFFVGTDKAYLRPESSDNTFYTSLKPWNRDKSDMANFPVFLEFWGWKL
jgi:hypothetical protein